MCCGHYGKDLSLNNTRMIRREFNPPPPTPPLPIQKQYLYSSLCFFVSFTFNANGLNLLSLATVLFYQKCQPIFFWKTI